MSPDGQRTKWRRKIGENFNRPSRVHQRQTTDGRAMAYIANVNVSSVKTDQFLLIKINLFRGALFIRTQYIECLSMSLYRLTEVMQIHKWPGVLAHLYTRWAKKPDHF